MSGSKRGDIIFFSFLLLPVMWGALLLAPYLSGGLPNVLLHIDEITSQPLTMKWTKDSPQALAIAILLYSIAVGYYLTTKKHLRYKEEHGSAKWGDAKTLNRKYQDKRKLQNKILTQHVKIGFDGKKHKRNLNVLVVGGSGAGKTRYYAKPNLMNCASSYMVLDPKGEILRDVGELLEKEGYIIKVIDLINMWKSHCFNPFRYLKSDNDVLKLINNLIKNTTPKGSNTNDPFWEKSETALLQALFLYLLHEAPEEEQNFSMVMEMIVAAEVKEEDEEYQSPLDILFERLEIRDPNHLAVKQHKIYKQAAGKTAKSILVSVGVRLAAFNLPELAGLTATDELEIDKMGERKTALFCIIPENDSSFNFIVGMLYTLMFQQLYYQADFVHDGCLPIHVHCVMDEFSNVALPDEFEKLLATMRSRNISVSIILQNISALKALFEKQWESIIGNCDEFLYLGGNEKSTHKYISELLDKETIDTNTFGKTYGSKGSYTKNDQNGGRELMTPGEVRMLDNKNAILIVRGELPVIDSKYDILRHPNIKHSADGNGNFYRHGKVDLAIDWKHRHMPQGTDYVILTEDEI